MARDEVGPLGIADDEVADLLRAEADAVEVIAGRDPAPLELAFEKMRRDRPPLDPHDRDRDDEQDQQRRARRSSRCGAQPRRRTTTSHRPSTLARPRSRRSPLGSY